MEQTKYTWMISTQGEGGLYIRSTSIFADFTSEEEGRQWIHEQLAIILLGGKLDKKLQQYAEMRTLGKILREQAKRYFYGRE